MAERLYIAAWCILFAIILTVLGLLAYAQWQSCMDKFPGDWFYCWKHIS